MSRIAPEDMTTLFSASDSKSTASSAALDLERMQIAHCINEAANCGEYSATYARPISSEMLQELEDENYEVTSPAPIAKPGDVSIISWANA